MTTGLNRTRISLTDWLRNSYNFITQCDLFISQNDCLRNRCPNAGGIFFGWGGGGKLTVYLWFLQSKHGLKIHSVIWSALQLCPMKIELEFSLYKFIIMYCEKWLNLYNLSLLLYIYNCVKIIFVIFNLAPWSRRKPNFQSIPSTFFFCHLRCCDKTHESISFRNVNNRHIGLRPMGLGGGGGCPLKFFK